MDEFDKLIQMIDEFCDWPNLELESESDTEDLAYVEYD